MLIEYKFAFITETHGCIARAGVRFYERPTLDDKRVQLGDMRIYTNKDFGQIKTHDEFRLFMNNELAKDKDRIPVEAQSELTDVTKVI